MLLKSHESLPTSLEAEPFVYWGSFWILIIWFFCSVPKALMLSQLQIQGKPALLKSRAKPSPLSGFLVVVVLWVMFAHFLITSAQGVWVSCCWQFWYIATMLHSKSISTFLPPHMYAVRNNYHCQSSLPANLLFFSPLGHAVNHFHIYNIRKVLWAIILVVNKLLLLLKCHGSLLNYWISLPVKTINLVSTTFLWASQSSMFYVSHKSAVFFFFCASRDSVAGISGLDKWGHPTQPFFGLGDSKLSLSPENWVFQTDAEILNTAKKVMRDLCGGDATSATGIPQASSHRIIAASAAAWKHNGYEHKKKFRLIWESRH